MTTKLVRDLMHIGVATCRADTSLVEAVRTLLRENLESCIVLDGNSHAVGMLGGREAEVGLQAAERELDELAQFARAHYGIDRLQAWDIGYYSEKLRQHRHNVSQEELKPYFPETRVVPGLFAVVERRYGLLGVFVVVGTD